MGTITDKIPYYVVKNGRGFWQPTKAMREAGFSSIRCGVDGPDAWPVARTWNERWQRHRQGRKQDALSKWPPGSIGEAFDRYRRTPAWLEDKKPRTREEWEAAWARIAPVFGDLAPTDPQISLETLAEFRSTVLETVSHKEAYRAIKIWRALWNVCTALNYCHGKADPSKGMRNAAPPPRNAVWRAGEVVRLAKAAWRWEYHGLAVAIAMAWDTQFSPVDLRQLTVGDIAGEGHGRHFPMDRTKTGRAGVGTLSRRTLALLDAYLALQPCEVGAILRNRSGAAYSRFTLPDDFKAVRDRLFPGDKRTLADMRRSGAVEANAGGASTAQVAAKMANTIDTSNALHRTYLPVDLESVRAADKARQRGRNRLRDSK